MKIYYNFLFLILILSLSSCATMKVKVAVLDKKKLKEFPGVLDAAVSEVEYEISKNLAENKYGTLKGELILDIRNSLDRSIADGELLKEAADPFYEAIYSEIETKIEAATIKFTKGLSQVESARSVADDPKRNRELLIDANISFSSGESILKDLRNKLHEDFLVGNKLGSFKSDEKEKFIKKTSALLGDSGLFGDPLVSFVANMDRKSWKGTYNKTITKNKFGTSDVAIKMESIGNFTIKGVRLDAANIVAASFKTLSQSIQFLSAVNGIPMSGKREMDSSEAELKNHLVDIEAQKGQMEIHETLAKLSTIAIMDAIISRKNDLSDPAKLPDAIKSIKTTFEIYKPQLNSKISSNE